MLSNTRVKHASLIFLIVFSLVSVYQDVVYDDSEPVDDAVLLDTTSESTLSNTARVENLHKGEKGFDREEARRELNQVLSVADPTQRDTQLEILFSKWLAVDPKDAMLAIAELLPNSDGVHIYHLAIGLWLDRRPKDLMQWLDKRDPSEELDLALAALCRDDETPESLAIQLAQNILDLRSNNETTMLVLQRWLARDPEEPLAWLGESAAHADSYAVSVYEILVKNNLPLALESINHLRFADKDHADAIGNLISGAIVEMDIDDGMMSSILTSLANHETQGIFRRFLPAVIKRIMPSQARLLVDELDDDLKGSMQQYLAYSWAKDDPRSAGEYALSLPPGSAQAQSINDVVRQWSTVDLHSASDWLTTVEGERDSAIRSITRAALDAGSIDLAKKWLTQIEDASLRQEPMFDIAHALYQEDPMMAKEYLEGATLFSGDEKKAILVFLENTNTIADKPRPQ